MHSGAEEPGPAREEECSLGVGLQQRLPSLYLRAQSVAERGSFHAAHAEHLYPIQEGTAKRPITLDWFLDIQKSRTEFSGDAYLYPSSNMGLKSLLGGLGKGRAALSFGGRGGAQSPGAE